MIAMTSVRLVDIGIPTRTSRRIGSSRFARRCVAPRRTNCYAAAPSGPTAVWTHRGSLFQRPQPITGSIFAKQSAKKTDSAANQKLDVFTYDTTLVKGLPGGLTEEDQEKLLKEKVLVRDQRDDDEVSVPYNVQTEKRLFNPTETGHSRNSHWSKPRARACSAPPPFR